MRGLKQGAGALLLGAALTLAMPALAQMGPGGGGPGSGGGGRGRGGPPGGGPGGGERPRMMKPVKREKLDKAVTGMFRTADKNSDGLVTFEELKAVIEARRDARIKARFERIDTDHNGALSAAEFFAWQHDMGSVASAEHQPVAEMGGPISESIAPDLDVDDMALRRLIEPLTAMVIVNANTNYDNGVSLDELLAYERRKFDAADSDHDGSLTMEELRAAEPRDRDGPGGPGGPGGPMGRPPRGED
ncbi:calcium-binding protein [Sphingomonas sp. R-74633]|uniref:calcium-binding protein n=1 Tax=Sphingomonas sp. R-74633 TaxID=2751188 RepID=UPI0015D37A7F|nr:calcium-binding protein [Sphingomonas sp. R-74633]NYT42234.1 calcium-binding protein [Sphingomonas sp. R-74633]